MVESECLEVRPHGCEQQTTSYAPGLRSAARDPYRGHPIRGPGDGCEPLGGLRKRPGGTPGSLPPGPRFPGGPPGGAHLGDRVRSTLPPGAPGLAPEQASEAGAHRPVSRLFGGRGAGLRGASPAHGRRGRHAGLGPPHLAIRRQRGRPVPRGAGASCAHRSDFIGPEGPAGRVALSAHLHRRPRRGRSGRRRAPVGSSQGNAPAHPRNPRAPRERCTADGRRPGDRP